MSRPDIIDRTYGSFVNSLSGLGTPKVRINIDPLPDPRLSVKASEVAVKHFGDNVSSRLPSKPNFTSALKWCWHGADTEFILNLEDDWVLIREVELSDLMKHFENPDIQQVVLRAYDYKYDKMCLSPSIIRTSWAKRFDFDEKLNPEVQLRKKFVKPSNITVHHKQVVVKDIGRNWMKDSGFKKPGHKATFTSWEKQ